MRWILSRGCVARHRRRDQTRDVPVRSRRAPLLAALLVLVASLLVATPRRVGAAAPADESWVPWLSATGAEVGCTKGSTDQHGICDGHHAYDAIDFLLPGGTPLLAPVDGTIAEVVSSCPDAYGSCGGGQGNYVRVAGVDGVHYFLSHLRTVAVTAGQPVAAGDPLGTVGRSGYATTDHVHYEERTPGGTRLEPGPMRGLQPDGTVRTYPAALGHASWYDVPSHADQMVIGVGVLPPPCLDEFSDVLVGNPFCDDVGWMVGAGITAGYADGTFRPFDPVSRQAMAMFVHRATPHGAEAVADPGFADVADTSSFHHPIAWAVAAGIADGYEDGTYRPLEPISRQAMAAFLWRRAGSPAGPYPDPGFTDVPADHPFRDAIAWAKATGVSTGWADGTFRPSIDISRQAMAAFLHRVVG